MTYPLTKVTNQKRATSSSSTAHGPKPSNLFFSVKLSNAHCNQPSCGTGCENAAEDEKGKHKWLPVFHDPPSVRLYSAPSKLSSVLMLIVCSVTPWHSNSGHISKVLVHRNTLILHILLDSSRSILTAGERSCTALTMSLNHRPYLKKKKHSVWYFLSAPTLPVNWKASQRSIVRVQI